MRLLQHFTVQIFLDFQFKLIYLKKSGCEFLIGFGKLFFYGKNDDNVRHLSFILQ